MITAEQVKQQCRITHDMENELLIHLAAAATSACLAYLNRPVFADDAALQAAIALDASVAEFGMVATKDMTWAMLITAANMYFDREGSNSLPHGAIVLLRQHRKLPGI